MGDDLFLQDSMLYSPDPWRVVLNTSPYLIAEALGIVLLLIFMRRTRKAAALGIVALACMFIVRFAWPFIQRAVEHLVIERGTLDFEYLEFCMFHGWLIVLILESLGLLLLIIAVFAWRSPPGDDRSAGRSASPHAAGFVQSATTPPTVVPQSTMHARPMAKGFYLGSLIVATVASVIFSCAGLAALGTREDEFIPFALGFSCFSMLITVYVVIVICLFVYRIWAAIQGGGYARTTPGKAVGFLFIPFFNLYWVFVAYRGWAEDYNCTVQSHGVSVPLMSMGLATTMCVLMVCSVVPYIGVLLGLVNFVFVCIFINNAINGVNALARMTPTGGA
jgi:hypothetical protein